MRNINWARNGKGYIFSQLYFLPNVPGFTIFLTPSSDFVLGGEVCNTGFLLRASTPAKSSPARRVLGMFRALSLEEYRAIRVVSASSVFKIGGCLAFGMTYVGEETWTVAESQKSRSSSLCAPSVTFRGLCWCLETSVSSRDSGNFCFTDLAITDALAITQLVAGSFTCTLLFRDKLSPYETREKDGMWWNSWWRKKLIGLFWIQLQGKSPSDAGIGAKRKVVVEYVEVVPSTVDEGFNPFVRPHE